MLVECVPWEHLPSRGSGDCPNSLPETPAAVPKEQQILLKISQDFLYQLVPWSVEFHVEITALEEGAFG